MSHTAFALFKWQRRPRASTAVEQVPEQRPSQVSQPFLQQDPPPQSFAASMVQSMTWGEHVSIFAEMQTSQAVFYRGGSCQGVNQILMMLFVVAISLSVNYTCYVVKDNRSLDRCLLGRMSERKQSAGVPQDMFMPVRASRTIALRITRRDANGCINRCLTRWSTCVHFSRLNLPAISCRSPKKYPDTWNILWSVLFETQSIRRFACLCSCAITGTFSHPSLPVFMALVLDRAQEWG